jgi:ketosteroid isomerase-like protein
VRQIHNILPLAVLALVLASCTPAPDTEGFRKTVEEFNAVSMESMEAGTTDKVISYYADNAVSMPPNMARVDGKAAIEKWMKEMMSSGMKVTKATFTTSEFGVGGDIAYEYGLYEMSMEFAGMDPMDDKGTYLSVWEKQQDGTWKIVAETWNSSNPVPGMGM